MFLLDKIPTKWYVFFFLRIFPLVFIYGGVGFLYTGVRQIYDAKQSNNWPIVEGVIVDRGVKEEMDDDGDVKYISEVEFSYEVRGKEYTSNAFSFGGYSSTKFEKAFDRVKKYQKGSKVQVAYHPEKPEKSTLETGDAGDTWFTILGGFIFFIPGVLMFFVLPRYINWRDC